jgi:transcriptional regulator with XRE-family HTH domain
MVDLIDEVETRRQALRLSQAEVAGALGVSQGQISKVIARKVALTGKMSARLTTWLGLREPAPTDLDEEILNKCMELMHLMRRRYEPNFDSRERRT